MNVISMLDSTLTNAIYTLPHPIFLDAVFHFFSGSGIFVYIWILLAIFLIMRHRNAFLGSLNVLSISSVITVLLTNVVVKNMFQRPRPLSFTPFIPSPVNELTYLLLPTTYPTDFAFPSGHTAFAFCVAYILAAYNKPRALLFYGTATLVAFSRVYLGFHYVSDVVFGAIFGILISWLTLNYFDKKLVTRKV